MLEHFKLLLEEWRQVTPSDKSSAWIRNIVDLEGHPVGFLGCKSDPKGSWLSWLRRATLEVYETPDASFLFKLTRAWGIFRSWDLHDAEERHVGTIYSDEIVTSDNVPLGRLLGDRILSMENEVLATLDRQTSGMVEVTFSREISGNPFVRMLTLGGVLIQDPFPKSKVC